LLSTITPEAFEAFQRFSKEMLSKTNWTIGTKEKFAKIIQIFLSKRSDPDPQHCPHEG
jgi:hypothetical protein